MRYSIALLTLVFTAFLMGCSSTIGTFTPSTNFTYPNSNVRPLGHVKVSAKKEDFFFAPALTKDNVTDLMNDALAQQPGADMLVNYRLDTTYTMFPFYYIQTITLEGTAVDMITLGEQDLHK